jgi:uncharacterized protein
MTSDERTLISTFFDRLNQAAFQPKDAEADEFIRAKIAEQPSAPYLLVQSALVMQQALTAAQTRIAELERRLAATSRSGPETGGSFLAGAASSFGGASSSSPPRSPQAPPPLPPQSASPSTLVPPPLPPAGPRGGGSFLQSALSTAAGVAGGALLFQGIQNLIGYNPGPFGGLTGPSGGLIGGDLPAGENAEVVNVFESKEPSPPEDQSVAQDDSPTSPDSDANTSTDQALDDSFASDDGGDFFGDDDSYV